MNYNEAVKKVKLEFLQKHNSAISKADAYKNFLQKIPAYQKLNKLERELIFEVGKNKFSKKSDENLVQNLKIVREQKDKILAKYKIKKSDLTPQFECDKCQDIGFIGSEQCDCFKNALNKELLKMGGLNPMSLASFDDYDTKICTDEKQATTLVKLKEKFQKWTNEFPKVKKNNLLLYGKVGVGKTFLCECIANELNKKGFSVCFVSAFDLNNMFLKYHTTFDSSKNSYLSPILNSDILIIDDLGTEPLINNVTENYLYLTLSERERFNKSVIITTNLEPVDIQNRYKDRICSRIFSKKTTASFHIDGNDLRISKN